MAVDALAGALVENSQLRAALTALESDRERLDRKLRQLERKLRGTTAP